MSKSNRNKIIWSVIILFIGLIIYSVLSSKLRPKGSEVTVTTVEERTIKETVSASGKIYPEKEVKISSDVSGEIVDLYVKEGDSVKVGQILIKIDPEIYNSSVERGQATLDNSKSQLSISKSQVESAKAQKEQILAQLENAKVIHKRNERLLKDGVISMADWEQSNMAVKQLEANLRSSDASIKAALQSAEAAEFAIKGAQATLKELKTNLNRTIIKSPTSGVVSSLSVEKGERVVGTIQMTGTEIMRISNLDVMEVVVNVSESDIVKVSQNDLAEVEVDAYPGRKFRGMVREVANSAANINSQLNAVAKDQVTNFVVKVRIDPDSYSDIKAKGRFPFRPGMSASVDIFTNEVKNAVSVPIQCVTVRPKETKEVTKGNNIGAEEEERNYNTHDEVVLVIENDTVKLLKVQTGIQDDEYIQVLKGLKKGSTIISGPYDLVSQKLTSGDKVFIKKDEKAKTKKKFLKK